MEMLNESDIYAEGGNYRVLIGTDGVAHFQVWRRPGWGGDAGAFYAHDMVRVFDMLMAEPWPRVRGVVFDLIQATTAWGPGTRASISDMFARMEQAGRWLAVVTAPDATQLMTVASVLKKNAPRCGRAFGSLSNGHTWAGQRKRMTS
jgi:hypothetical protein